MRTTTTGPDPALDPDRLYQGDNGRIFCGAPRCAGITAAMTGRTVAGQRVALVTARTAEVWVNAVGYAPRCESCGKGFGA